jgi:hypothetical protein
MADPLPPPLPRPRTSLKRGAAALLLAPMAAIVPLGMISLLKVSMGLGGGCARPSMSNEMHNLATAALVLGGTTLLLGLPTWVFLRLTGRESAGAYLAAGLLEGLLCAFYLAYSLTGALKADQATGFCLTSLAGGAIAWAFWRLAREPGDF